MVIEFKPKIELPKVAVKAPVVFEKVHSPAKVRIPAIKDPLDQMDDEAPKKGRPSTGKAKKAVTFRLDQDVAAALEARKDWRAEVNTVLRKHLGL
jgi:uncharacterized protein (DUF4415 family)